MTLVTMTLLPANAQAQARAESFPVLVRVSSDAGEPIAQALVRLISGDETIAQRFTDEVGFARFEISEPGEFRFAVDRLGYAAWESDKIRLDAEPAEPVHLAVDVDPVTLDAIVVQSSTRCARDRPLLVRLIGSVLGRSDRQSTPQAAARLARVHHHAMTTLERVIEDRPADATYSLRLVDTTPEFAEQRPVVIGEIPDTTLVQRRSPLESPDADILAADGFMQPRDSAEAYGTYHPLTPEVIASESFAMTHCFQVVEQPDSGWMGLAFEPLPRSLSYDVRGVVWVDTLAGLPRRIEFNYTRLADFLVESGEAAAAQRRGFERDRVVESRRMASATRRLQQMTGAKESRQVSLVYRPNPDENEFGGTIEFGAISSEGRWDIVRWQLRWPGLLGSTTFHAVAPGANRASSPGRGPVLDRFVNFTTTILHYARTVEILGVTSEGRLRNATATFGACTTACTVRPQQAVH